MRSRSRLLAAACAATLVPALLPAAPDAAIAPTNTPPPATKEPSPLVPAVGLSLDFCSRQLTYGLADNRDPIVTPGATLTWLDWFNVSAAFILDTTDWGDRNVHPNGPGYGNRAWRYQEFDPGIGLAHSFGPDDWKFLPTMVDFSIGYMYEYHPRFSKSKSDGVNGNPDTQFINLGFGLPDLWFEPVLATEFDIDRDHGIYIQPGIGHTFSLIDARAGEEDSVLDLNIALAQGLGDPARNDSYLGVNRWGLMDSSVVVTLSWRPLPWLTIAPYAGVYEYLFDSKLRDAAREYSYGGDPRTDSYNIVGGLAVTASF